MHIYRLAAFIGVLALSERVKADPFNPDTTPVDSFRHIRQECLVNTECRLSSLGGSHDKPRVTSTPGPEVLKIKPVESFLDELPEQPSIVVQKYIPDKDDSAEILSFEAWKEKQFREAVASGLVHGIEPEEPAEPRNVDPDVQVNAQTHTGQPPNDAGKSQQDVHQEVPKQKVKDPMSNSKTGGSAGKQVSNPPHRYNYASPDCSARVISSSSASQHASSVLHKSKDRYMLTPCNAKEHWVVIELCDEIRIEAVEIGMFEFFSGVVKQVVLSVDALEDDEADGMEEDGEGTSRKGNEWEQVAVFEAKNVRGSQMFNLPSPTSFHRFIRLDFPAYYGKEYYCPISSVKAYGMNQMEAFKWESKRNKQREDEWARRQADEERKRRLPLPASSEPISVQTATVAEPKSRNPRQEDSMAGSQSRTIDSASAGVQHSASVTEPTLSTATTLDQPRSTGLTVQPPKATASGVSESSNAPLSSDSLPVNTTHNASVVDSAFPDRTILSTVGRIGSEVNATTNHEADQVNATITEVKPQAKSQEPAQETHTLSGKKADQPTSISQSSSTTSRPVASHSASSSSATPRQNNNVKADSSESIYAFIIRRLNALEGNATLGMMYVEEQSRVNRGLLNQLEKSWSQWRVDQAQQQRLAAEKTRIATDETFEQMLVRMDQRDLVLIETIAKLQNQLSSMTEEIAWEKRRGIAQLILLLTVIALSALSRSATVDVQAVRPLIQARNSTMAELKRTKQDAETGETTFVIDGQEPVKSPLARTRSLGHSRGSPRRPGTPVPVNKKSRPTLTLNAKVLSDRLELPRTAVPTRSRHLIPNNITPHLNGKRLARSSHLHTIDADRIRRKMQMESTDIQATPSKSFSGSATPFLATPRQAIPGTRSTEDAVIDTVESEFSEYDLASASEAEGELDAQGGFTI